MQSGSPKKPANAPSRWSRWWGGSKGSNPTSTELKDLDRVSNPQAVSSSPAPLPAPQEPGELSIELNIYKNLKISVSVLEKQLRQQFEKILEPTVYQHYIEKGERDSAKRYITTAFHKKDPIFYYLNLLNLLM